MTQQRHHKHQQLITETENTNGQKFSPIDVVTIRVSATRASFCMTACSAFIIFTRWGTPLQLTTFFMTSELAECFTSHATRRLASPVNEIQYSILECFCWILHQYFIMVYHRKLQRFGLEEWCKPHNNYGVPLIMHMTIKHYYYYGQIKSGYWVQISV